MSSVSTSSSANSAIGDLLEGLARLCASNLGAAQRLLVIRHQQTVGDPEWLVVCEAASASEAPLFRVPREPLSERAAPTAVLHRTLEQRSAVLIEDVPASPFADDPYLASHGVASLLCVPLFSEGKVSGLIYIEQTGGPYFATAAALVAFDALAAHAAIVLDVASRQEKLERRFAFELLVSDLAAACAKVSREELDTELERWLGRLADFLSVDRVSVYEYSDTDGALHRRYLFCQEGIEPPPPIIERTYVPEAFAALERGEAVNYAHFGDVSSADRMGMAPFRFRSAQMVPITTPNAGFGCLVLSSLRAERTVDEEVARRLPAVADIFGNALAQKHADAQRESGALAAPGVELSQLMIDVLSHDFRNPLSAISGLSQLLLSRGELPADVVRRVTAINAAAERMDALIDTLLDLGEARLRGGLKIARAAVDLNALCLLAINEQIAEHGGGKVAFESPGALRGSWDPARMSQIVNALLSNALARSEGRGEVKLALRDDNGSVVLEVRDAGPVIPSATLRQIFEPLTQEQPTARAYAQGLTLRLYIVQQIAASHGGSLTVESMRARGTSFTVRLPHTA